MSPGEPAAPAASPFGVRSTCPRAVRTAVTAAAAMILASIIYPGQATMFLYPLLIGAVSIVGTVIKTGRSYLTNDLKAHDGYNSAMDEQTGFDGHNMICAPIKSITGNSVTGAVQLLNKRERQPFTGDDQNRLEEIAQEEPYGERVGWLRYLFGMRPGPSGVRRVPSSAAPVPG